MNLDNVAKLVHELAKDPNGSSILLAQLKAICEMTSSEFDAITKAFSRVELSCDVLDRNIMPAVYWV